MLALRVGLIISLISLLFLPAPGNAQLPRGNWWENEDTRKAIDITEEQLVRIKEIVKSGQEKIKNLHKEYGEKSKKLREMMKIDKLRDISEEQLNKLFDDLQSTRGMVEKTRFIHMVRALKVLTEEQAAKLAEKQEEMLQKFKEKARRKHGEPGRSRSPHSAPQPGPQHK